MQNPLPVIETDLLLLHPPAYYDFRNRRDIYFPFLETAGAVPITPLYEYFPLGFKTLQHYLASLGHDVEIINLSSILLRYPEIDLDMLFKSIDTRMVGIDLHWMVHVQGCLSIAELFKQVHPEVPVILGGVSSTYFANELIRYPVVDMVMRGYDTHLPMAQLMKELKSNQKYENIPNLLWKTSGGDVYDNGIKHIPEDYGVDIDWSALPPETGGNSIPIVELLSVQNSGCSYNCGWCGGSRDAFRRLYGSQYSVAHKPTKEVEKEFLSLGKLPAAKQFLYYVANAYNEPKNRLEHFIELIGCSNLRSVNYEQYHLTPLEIMRWMVKANDRTIITLSPESHDMRVGKLAGRGVYTNQELELWLEQAFEIGIYQVDIWYFVGMPEQNSSSVFETVAYCERLLEKFKGQRINPMICPMIPFLDPGSNFFENPVKHGYRLFYHNVEEHRRAMERASIINRINYETKWLSRRDLIHVGYEAVRRLMDLKSSYGQLPTTLTANFTSKIDDALVFIDVVDQIDNIKDPEIRKLELDNLGDEILRRNNMIFFDGVMNQAFPVNRQVGGRWFDEMGWGIEEFESVVFSPQG